MRYPYDVRIIGGKHRSRRIKLPDDKSIRPTANRSREAIFNMLSHAKNGQSALVGARVLDVFSGTGALGLESLSRGAMHATFIDINTSLTEVNIATLGEQAGSKVIQSDVKALPDNTDETYDVIFLDPPYDSGLIEPTLQLLKEKGYVEPGAVIVAESSSQEMYKTPSDFNKFDERVYGQSRFSFIANEADVA